MKSGGFDMYLTKRKGSASIYQSYAPRFKPKYGETEVSAYISGKVAHSISRGMKNYTVHMAHRVGTGLCDRRD